jgi:hypothetical protein
MTIIPYVKRTESRDTPAGLPWIIYTVAHPNCGGEYRVTVRELADRSWSISAPGYDSDRLSRRPTPDEVCAWFATRPRRLALST